MEKINRRGELDKITVWNFSGSESIDIKTSARSRFYF